MSREIHFLLVTLAERNFFLNHSFVFMRILIMFVSRMKIFFEGRLLSRDFILVGFAEIR